MDGGASERVSERPRAKRLVKIEGGGTRRPDLLTRESLSIKVAPSAETMTPLILARLLGVGGWVGGAKSLARSLFGYVLAPLETCCAGAR
jgi:hypothetical protein